MFCIRIRGLSKAACLFAFDIFRVTFLNCGAFYDFTDYHYVYV